MEKGSSAQEHGLLDLLIAVVQHTRLLVIVPLLAGIAGFTLAYLKPPTYTSEAILAMAEGESKRAALMMVTPLVIDPVIDKQNLAKDMPLEQARDQLIGQIRAIVARDGLLRIEVGAPSPAQAQLLARAVIDSWRATTVPGEQEKQELQTRLIYVQKMLQSIDLLMARLTTESPVYFDGAVTRGDRGLTLVSLGELQAKYFAESHAIPRTLQGVSPDVVRQQPSLPTKPAPAGKSSFAILLTVSTFLLLLIAVLMKHLLGRYVVDARNAASLARLRAALFSGTKAVPPQTATPHD